MAIKWNFNSKYNFSNRNFAKIYSFFVIESPVEGASVRGKTFKQRNINLRSLHNSIKNKIPSLKESWKTASAKEIDTIVKDNSIYNAVSLPLEIAIHTERDRSKTVGLYYAIRCAFAHGSFSIHKCSNENFYFFENRHNSRLKARIVLKEQSLIDLITVLDEAKKK